MSLPTATYPIAPRGLATSFTEAETPVEYALKFRNRYINAAGGAEKRQGIAALGSAVSGGPTVTGVHELVKSDGTAILFVSAAGVIYRYDNISTYTQVYSGLDSSAYLKSVQMADKLIFINGVDRNLYTSDGTNFYELQAIIEKGKSTSGSVATTLRDSGVTNWLLTDVAVNDIVHNITKGAYGIVTVVASTSVEHTTIGSAGTGIGFSSGGNQGTGDRYELIDAVELNIIPTDNPDDPDNVATLTSGASAVVVAVSGVNFATTDIRKGDWIYNSTRAALTKATSVSANVVVSSVAGQVSGDAVVFLKSAMPISIDAHVHYKRLYLVDERDQTKIRVSGPRDPQDFTTGAATIDTISVDTGAFQPEGDTINGLNSFQRFLVLHGKRNTFMFQGIDPVASSASAPTDFSVVGLFPQGLVARGATQNLGNDLAYVTPDGVQSISLVYDASKLNRENLSESLRVTMRELIPSVPESQILTTHYARRSWLLVKIGSQLFVYNYTPFLGSNGQVNPATQGGKLSPQGGSWSLFDGKFAQQLAYFVRNDGTLICAGQNGKVYEFDQGTYDDDGDPISTEYQTPWLTMDEPKRSVNIKDGRYIKPIVDAAADIVYTISVEAGFQSEATDSIQVTASGALSRPIGALTIGTDTIGGSGITNIKYPLRWRSDVARFTFATNDSSGPDVLSRFAVYVLKRGKR